MEITFTKKQFAKFQRAFQEYLSEIAALRQKQKHIVQAAIRDLEKRKTEELKRRLRE